MRRWKLATAAGLVGLALAGNAAAAPDTRVWAAVQAARPGQIDLLQQIVDIDSGTGDAAGANKIQAILGARLKALGAVIQVLPPRRPVSATIRSPSSTASARPAS